jgi:hypothetical protein
MWYSTLYFRLLGLKMAVMVNWTVSGGLGEAQSEKILNASTGNRAAFVTMRDLLFSFLTAFGTLDNYP